MNWDPVKVFEPLESGRIDGNSEAYGNLLGTCPVAHVAVDGSEYWGVFSYAELIKAVSDIKTFSNVTALQGPRIVPLQSDPPEHTAYRRLLNPHFTFDKINAMADGTRQLAREMIGAMIAQGSADFAQAFAYPFPTRVLCKFLQVKDEDWHKHHHFVTELERITGHGLSAPTESMEGPAQFFMPYLMNVIQERRAHLADDVISGIITGEVQGQKLDDPAIVFLVMTLMMAGHITTTSATGNFVLRLAQDRPLQDLLRADPSRIPDAVEECLRIDTPQQAMPRRCVADTELGGQSMKTGDYLLMNFGSANVDPQHWPEPGKFDIERKDKRHLAFGRGIHSCLGSALARMELRVLTEELLSLTNSFSLNGEVRRHAWPRLSVESMPLAFVARAGVHGAAAGMDERGLM
jgi:cytochrome P450